MPSSSPFSTAVRKWNPISTRDSPFSAAAWDSRLNERRTAPGSVQVPPAGRVRLQAENATRSVPRMPRSTAAAVAPSTACADS